MISLSKIVSNKVVQHIPIYSMFDRDSHKVNLACDGNANRCVTAYYQNPTFTKLLLHAPTEENSINLDQLKKWISQIDGAIQVIPDQNMKMSALYQRQEEFASKETFSQQADLIIFEGQELGKRLLSERKPNQLLAYWCPVCATRKKTRSFLEGWKEQNQELFKAVDYVIVASNDQIQYLKELNVDDGKICLVDKLIDRSIPMFKEYTVDNEVIQLIQRLKREHQFVVYLPFRLSDEGYQLQNVLRALSRVDAVLIYPNLNGVGVQQLMAKFKDQNKESLVKMLVDGVKISSSRDTMYTILDHGYGVIIPYFEDCQFINHATEQELFDPKNLPVCWVVKSQRQLREIIGRGRTDLFVIEGFDRVGKNTLISEVVQTYHAAQFKQPASQDVGIDYRDVEKFQKYLGKHYKDVIWALLQKIGQDIVVTSRLFVSDMAYSKLFGRKFQFGPLAESFGLGKLFNVHSFCILWKTFDDYKKRCEQSGSEVQYNEEQFEKLSKLFQEATDEYGGEVIRVEAATSREEVFEKFKEFLKQRALSIDLRQSQE